MVKYKLDRPLKILTVCGVGQGSSLIMRMFVEDVLKELNIPAKVEHTELLTAKSSDADIIIASIIHEEEFKDSTKIIIGLKNLVDKNEIKEKLLEALSKRGIIEID
ncbi:hypothetical protein EP1X_01305 [Thermococcus sp. EP1]|uniref:PTS sugar transporter subunit IIB n=1 Tax=Thermococcus sp. EP1 TaxID=1591054 RepID=UPI0006DB7027|nr:PTS sugar transporter subunit IIB [Thermococcus sp. EP1]KPU63862.1 hypothetical protein EP1X_01305 [Thermococcus sp. EP1]